MNMQGSFWRNVHGMSGGMGGGLDELLERDDVTLEEILSHDEVIQECKYMNTQLIEYLSNRDVIERLIRYVIERPPETEAEQHDEHTNSNTPTNSVQPLSPTSNSISTSESENETDSDTTPAANATDISTAAAASDADTGSATNESATPPTDSSITSDKNARVKSDGATPPNNDVALDEGSVANAVEAASTDDAKTAPSSDAGENAVPSNTSSTNATDDSKTADTSESIIQSTSMSLPASESDSKKSESENQSGEATSNDHDTINATDAQETGIDEFLLPLSSTSNEEQLSNASASVPTSASTSSSDEASESTSSRPRLSNASDTTTSAANIHRYPYVASELFACEVISMLDVLFEDTAPLDLLFSFLDRPPAVNESGQVNEKGVIDPSEASYFRKVVVVLIQRKYEPLVRYIAANHTVDKLVQHIGLYSVMELLIMIGWDDGLNQVQDTDWLYHEQLVPKLVSKLSPVYENVPDVHMNAARALVDVVVKCPPSSKSALVSHLQSTPVLEQIFTHMFSGSMSSLTNAMSIIIVLIQRYANRKAELAEPHELAESEQMHSNDQSNASSTSVTHDVLDTSEELMEEPFITLLPHLPKLLALLHDSPPASAPPPATANSSSDIETSPLAAPSNRAFPSLSHSEVSTQFGRAKQFGETRMKVVELCLVLFRSHVPRVDAVLIEEKVLSTLLDAFFAYPWNNMLHGLVESIIRTVLDSDSPSLRRSLFQDAQLVDKFIHAFELNQKIGERMSKVENGYSDGTSSVNSSHQYRQGYMGHLIRTATAIDEMCKRDEDMSSILLGSKVHEWNDLLVDRLEIELERQKIGALAPFGSDDDLLDGLHFDMNIAGAHTGGGTSFITGTASDMQMQMQLDDTDGAFGDAFSAEHDDLAEHDQEQQEHLGFQYGSNESAQNTNLQWTNSNETAEGNELQHHHATHDPSNELNTWANFNDFEQQQHQTDDGVHGTATATALSGDRDTDAARRVGISEAHEYNRGKRGSDAARTLMQFNISNEDEEDAVSSELVGVGTSPSPSSMHEPDSMAVHEEEEQPQLQIPDTTNDDSKYNGSESDAQSPHHYHVEEASHPIQSSSSTDSNPSTSTLDTPHRRDESTTASSASLDNSTDVLNADIALDKLQIHHDPSERENENGNIHQKNSSEPTDAASTASTSKA